MTNQHSFLSIFRLLSVLIGITEAVHRNIGSLLFYQIHNKTILNQNPNTSSNNFSINSNSYGCRTIPFKLWLDKCIVEFERSVRFHARAIVFALAYYLFEKAKKKREKNLY